MQRLSQLLALLGTGLLLAISTLGCNDKQPPEMRINGPGGEVLFCFWNVENLFDDQNDHRTGPGDKEYDPWFANHPEILKLKLSKLSEALIAMNGGRGPDILAVCEVESLRAAELLQRALNERLADSRLHYNHVLMEEIKGGRHIAPAIITRLPVVADKTRTHGKRQRMLQGHILVDGHELIVLASHWTSRLKEGSDHGRNDYADKLYGAVNAMYHNNPNVDVLICGDFNATPQDEAVTKNLHATGDRDAVRTEGPLHLFNLMAGKDPLGGFGTHYYHKWLTYDHIVVSPGMLDATGWSCDPASVSVDQALVKPGDTKGRPWRFGGEHEKGARGYSDHFPVTVRLKVHR